MRLFGSDRIIDMVDRLGLEEDQPIDVKIISNSIESAQKRLEAQNFARRKNVLTYDDVMNQQRTVIYKQRGEVLDGLDLKEKIRNMISKIINMAVDMSIQGENRDEWNFDELRNYFFGSLCSADDFKYTENELSEITPESIKEYLEEKADALYAEKERIFGEEQMREIERILLLRSVDRRWMDHIDAMDDLKGSVGLSAYAQRDPLKEYQIQGGDMFDEMIAAICEDTARAVLSVTPKPQELKREAVAKITNAGVVGGEQKSVKKPVKKDVKVGRNDPCPCGSGKKYKKCCGANENTAE